MGRGRHGPGQSSGRVSDGAFASYLRQPGSATDSTIFGHLTACRQGSLDFRAVPHVPAYTTRAVAVAVPAAGRRGPTMDTEALLNE